MGDSIGSFGERCLRPPAGALAALNSTRCYSRIFSGHDRERSGAFARHTPSTSTSWSGLSDEPRQRLVVDLAVVHDRINVANLYRRARPESWPRSR